MRTLLFLLVCFITHIAYGQTMAYENDSMVIKVTGKDSTIIVKPSRSSEANIVYMKDLPMPHYIGDLDSFIRKNLRYPVDAREKQIEGSVWVYVRIDTAGNAVDPIIAHSVSPSVDAEALRIIALMKRSWVPLRLYGKVYHFDMNIEVPFKL
ncbi:energy transducer TonB [Chitinophagaceae bacterium MMS25-I14]